MNKLFLRLAIRILRKVETKSAFYLGKGSGATSIQQEVELATTFLTEPPKLIVDIGANIGKYSEQLLEKFPNVEIHAIEPSVTNAKLLREKFNSKKNVHVFEGAISSEIGIATLYSNVDGSSLSSLVKRKLDHYEIIMDITNEVKTVTFENYYNTYLQGRTVDLVKIDIEGFELDALKGFNQVIEKCKVIQFEFGGCNIDTRSFFQNFWYFFKNANFKLFRISPIGLVPITHYLEEDEVFRTTNYIAVRDNFSENVDAT